MTDEHIPDQELVVSAKQDREAFIGLYQRDLNKIYGYYLVRTGHEQDAQDLTSETFLAAMDSLNNFRPSSRFGAWLMGIAHHKLVDYYRGHSTPLSLEQVPEPPAPNPTPEQQVSHQSDLKRVHQALKHLTVDRANAVSLRYFGGLNVAETAKIMDKSRSAVKMLVMRGLQDLRDHLSVAMPEEANDE